MWGAIVGAAVQGAGSLLGQFMSAKANRERAIENDRLYRDAKRDAESQRFTDFLNTDSGKALRTVMEEEYRGAYRNVNANAMRGSVSGEAKMSGINAVNSGYIGAYGKLSQAGQAYRQNALNQYNSIMANARKQKHDDMNAMYADRTKSALNLESNAAKVGAGMIDSDSIGKVKGGTVVGVSSVGDMDYEGTDLLNGTSYLR